MSSAENVFYSRFTNIKRVLYVSNPDMRRLIPQIHLSLLKKRSNEKNDGADNIANYQTIRTRSNPC